MGTRRGQLGTVERVKRMHVRVAAFSLAEILVVIAIIGILLAVVFKGGSSLIESAQKRDTEALLKKLDMAIDEYRREVDTSRINFAKNIFNGCPPDNLLAFVGREVAIGGCPIRLRNTGEIRLNESALSDDDQIRSIRYGDIRALVLAIRLNSPKAKSILDSIDPKYWAEPDNNNIYDFEPAANQPTVRLDYLVDSWGVPLEYFSSCICKENAEVKPRERVSNAFVHENNDGGIVVSYGPNGRDQFDPDMVLGEGPTDMVSDWMDATSPGVINHPFNTDNLYSSDFFANRIRQVPAP
jgi:type II secretory pathway pseudopilin PulG